MYEERILKEFPQQFQGQETIAVLVRALARQLDELHQVFDALTRMRSVDTAQGAQLDGAGDIVVLTRSDAMRLIKGAITYDIIDDEHYRHYTGSALKVGNSYAKAHAKAFYEGMRAQGQTDIVNLLRCAWVGSQSYAALLRLPLLR